MNRIWAIVLLLWNMIGLIFTKFGKLFRRTPTEKDKFLQYYEPDKLWSLFPEVEKDRYVFSGCIACGLCESFLASVSPSIHLHRIPTLPQELIWGASRELPAFGYVQEILHPYAAHFKELELLCPAHIPFEKLLVFAKLYGQYQDEQQHK